MAVFFGKNCLQGTRRTRPWLSGRVVVQFMFSSVSFYTCIETSVLAKCMFLLYTHFSFIIVVSVAYSMVCSLFGGMSSKKFQFLPPPPQCFKEIPNIIELSVLFGNLLKKKEKKNWPISELFNK